MGLGQWWDHQPFVNKIALGILGAAGVAATGGALLGGGAAAAGEGAGAAAGAGAGVTDVGAVAAGAAPVAPTALSVPAAGGSSLGWLGTAFQPKALPYWDRAAALVPRRPQQQPIQPQPSPQPHTQYPPQQQQTPSIEDIYRMLHVNGGYQ